MEAPVNQDRSSVWLWRACLVKARLAAPRFFAQTFPYAKADASYPEAQRLRFQSKHFSS